MSRDNCPFLYLDKEKSKYARWLQEICEHAENRTLSDCDISYENCTFYLENGFQFLGAIKKWDKACQELDEETLTPPEHLSFSAAAAAPPSLLLSRTGSGFEGTSEAIAASMAASSSEEAYGFYQDPDHGVARGGAGAPDYTTDRREQIRHSGNEKFNRAAKIMAGFASLAGEGLRGQVITIDQCEGLPIGYSLYFYFEGDENSPEKPIFALVRNSDRSLISATRAGIDNAEMNAEMKEIITHLSSKKEVFDLVDKVTLNLRTVESELEERIKSTVAEKYGSPSTNPSSAAASGIGTRRLSY